MNRRSADEGTNSFADQMGKEFYGKDFSYTTELNDPKLNVSKFSGDGIPAKQIDWIKDGVIKNLPIDRSYAKMINEEPNFPGNIKIAGGNMTEEKMMQEVGSGIIINNFWYIRFVDARKGELTGLTRDGVAYFEDGKIKHAVHNFRWNEVLNEVTKRIMGVGKIDYVQSNLAVPSLLVKDFNFVDTTTF
jgi:predicted Zn-dependent protease